MEILYHLFSSSISGIIAIDDIWTAFIVLFLHQRQLHSFLRVIQHYPFLQNIGYINLWKRLHSRCALTTSVLNRQISLSYA